LVNPKAGPASSESLVNDLTWGLCRQRLKVEVFTDLAAAMAQANRIHVDGGLRALVGVGGDGTAAALVNGTAEGVPITLFPGGNSNLLARYFGLTKNPEQICRVIGDGMTVRTDAGLANGRIFLLMAGCGFDAEVVRRVHEQRTTHISQFKYVKPIFKSIWSYRFPEIRVDLESQQEAWDDPVQSATALSARWAFAFNLPCYAGGLVAAPKANGNDGLFDVCSFRRGGFFSGLGLLAAVAIHRPSWLPGCTIRRTKRLYLTSEAKVPYQLDGDHGGFLPLELQVLPNRLTFLAPSPQPPDL
jgi:diacylglycerol kinase (ATP)